MMAIDFAAWAAARPGTYPIEFVEWASENPHIIEAFFRQANAMRARGRSHYSARTIVEFLRHHTALAESGEWKINDHAVPYLGRLFMDIHPSAGRFFAKRATNLEKVAA